MDAASTRPGSARVLRVGDGVAPSRTFLETQPQDRAHYSRRRLPHFEKPWAIYAVTIGTKKDRCLSPKARRIVLNPLRHFHNQRYDLFAKEHFDRYVRSDRDLKEKFHYILRNPWDSDVAGQNEDYPWVWTQVDKYRRESSFRRDAETSTRDACATQRRDP